MTHPSRPDSCFSMSLPQGPRPWLGARHVLGRHVLGRREALDLIHHHLPESTPEHYYKYCFHHSLIVLGVPKSRFLEENVTRFKRMWNLFHVLTWMAALWAGNCINRGSHTGWPTRGPSVHPQQPWGLSVEGPRVSTREMNTASITYCVSWSPSSGCWWALFPRQGF